MGLVHQEISAHEFPESHALITKLQLPLNDWANLENGSIGIRVDGNNALGVLHPSQVLYSAGYANCNIQLWRDDFASLSNLHPGPIRAVNKPHSQ